MWEGCFNKVFKCVEALAHRCFTPTTHPGLHFIGCDRESILTVQDVKHVIQLMIIHTPGMNDGVRSVPNLYYGWWSSDASKLHGHEIRDLVMHRLVPLIIGNKVFFPSKSMRVELLLLMVDLLLIHHLTMDPHWIPTCDSDYFMKIGARCLRRFQWLMMMELKKAIPTESDKAHMVAPGDGVDIPKSHQFMDTILAILRLGAARLFGTEHHERQNTNIRSGVSRSNRHQDPLRG